MVFTKEEKMAFSRRLRRNQTMAEKKLWGRLRRKKLGWKFRRQQLKYGYILDFYCPKFKLAIEIDGRGHNAKNDEIRDDNLGRYGIDVLRFTNTDVFCDIDLVVAEIKKRI